MRDGKGVKFYKLMDSQSTSNQPLKISHIISLNPDYSWTVFVHNYEVKPGCIALRSIPRAIDNSISINNFVKLVNDLDVCALKASNLLVNFWCACIYCLLGLCLHFLIVVNSFVELSQYLLTKHEKESLFLLSERLTQE